MRSTDAQLSEYLGPLQRQIVQCSPRCDLPSSWDGGQGGGGGGRNDPSRDDNLSWVLVQDGAAG